MRHHRNHRQQPLGFTLVELLMVIGIIGFLVTVSGVIIGNMIGNAKEARTKATIAKIHELVMERRRGLDVAMEKNARIFAQAKKFSVDLDPSPSIEFWISGPVAFNKVSVKQMLPTRLEDLSGQALALFLTLPGTKQYANVAGYRNDPSAPLDPGDESSELLYFALTQGTSFGEDSDASGQFTDSEAKDTNGNGRPEILDAWENPIRFFLWPTRLVRPNGWTIVSGRPVLEPLNQTIITSVLPTLSGRDVSVDPDDPTGMFLDQYVGSFFAAYGSTDINAALTSYENNFHTYSTYHAPLVVSAGPDGVLGIIEGNVSTPLKGYLGAPDLSSGSVTDELYDNITNYQGLNN